MKRKFIYSLVAIFSVLAMSSCTMEFDDIKDSAAGIALNPKFNAYSGEHIWNSTGTRSADVNGNMWNQTWDCVPNVDLTDDDLAEIKSLLSPGKPTENTITLPFENYWVQQVFKGDSKYYAVDKGGSQTNTEVTGSNHMDKLVAWNGYGYEHINNFDNGDNKTTYGTCGCGINHTGTTLMTNMPTEGFGPNEQFGYHETWGTLNKDRNTYHYYIIQYKGEWYVGFDYHSETDRQNPGEASAVDRDWCFTDWIVKITPAYAAGTTPETPDNCDECGHKSHEGNCTECEEGSVCNPKGNITPEIPEVPKTVDEVEINLSLDRKNDDLLESHLSIHVRTATNVEVFIPIKEYYYCEKDDMEIVIKHYEPELIHGGPTQVEYNVNGNIVTLNVSFEHDGIRIWTEGINEDVINYCREKYDDGITFEVWNYFNDPAVLEELGIEGITMEDLKLSLDKATVKFLDKVPGKYVNAFGKENGKYDQENNIDGNDFHVVPEHYENDFNEPQDGEHLNGSHNNEIYTKK